MCVWGGGGEKGGGGSCLSLTPILPPTSLSFSRAAHATALRAGKEWVELQKTVAVYCLSCVLSTGVISMSTLMATPIF